MSYNRKTFSIILGLSIMILASAATIGSDGKYKNLKILPKDIPAQKLDSIMNAYNVALKVSCDFCHIKPKKDLFSVAPQKDELDFALDNPMKEEARKMIKLQMEINQNYFRHDSTIRPEYMNVVSCNTCHRGNPYPAHE